MRQKNQVELNLGTGAKGEARSAAAQETEARAARAGLERPAVAGPSMEAIVERENLKKALAQVKRNKGAAGIDGMSVEDLAAYLKEHWPTIRAQLLDGTYKPQPVRRVEIPKASGGMRPLGIPTVLDRFIQQAVMQVLQADWDRTFSEASFGFRPGHSAHQAVERAQAYIASGYAVVVDIDLEKFFDRVNHDVLMGLVAKRVADKRILKLIRGFLTAGAMEGGLVSPTEEGTPQGGPLSPLSPPLGSQRRAVYSSFSHEFVTPKGHRCSSDFRQCCVAYPENRSRGTTDAPLDLRCGTNLTGGISLGASSRNDRANRPMRSR